MPLSWQARSELVDTEGSAFYRECADALDASDYGAIVEKFIKHVDLIFEKASNNGETLHVVLKAAVRQSICEPFVEELANLFSCYLHGCLNL